MKLKTLCVVGTRPEAIKMAPIISELRRHPRAFEVVVMATAQHRALLDQVFDVFGIRPDADLNVMTENQPLNAVAARILSGLEDWLVRAPPDLVLAQGDTTTVMAAAAACFHRRVRFGHVEAGLRTGDLQAPFPEEFNRRVASIVADFHFAPTRDAARNLRREGIAVEKIFVTGNPVIDALRDILDNTPPPPRPVPADQPYILMTCHRREIFGHPIRRVFRAVRDFARTHPGLTVWYPVHPNPNVRKDAYAILGRTRNIVLSPPLDYISFVHAMAGARVILSDSGGVQEEAPALHKPVVLLRDVTERPEGVRTGACRLAGPHPERIRAALTELLDNPAVYRRMAGARNPYGDGHAARRIAAILRGRTPRPWAG
jgi:UDP-N-acetylglucosamine 2-epimerase (non-hydrolysing)